MGYSNSHGSENYTCGTNRRYGKAFCSAHYIRKDVLEQAVLSDIRKYSKLAAGQADELARRLIKQNGGRSAEQIKALKAELSKLRTRDAELDNVLKRLYEDNVSGKLSDERFDKFLSGYEQEQSDVQTRIEDTRGKIDRLNASRIDTDSWVRLIKNYTRIKKLDRTILGELVDKITIGEPRIIDGQRTTDITIYYRFVGAVR
jgi:chromosome segregation ATPase